MSVAEHDQDFFLWTRQQADALRRLAETRPNADIDWPNLIEEVEDLGKEQEYAVETHLRVALVNLLVLAHSTDGNSRDARCEEVLEQRIDIDRRIASSPSIRMRLPEMLTSCYRRARKHAALKLNVYVSELPENCPFALDQVLDDDWFPHAPTEVGSAE
jgi:hypothetical protein